MNVELTVTGEEVAFGLLEVRRELALRARVYPFWIQTGRLKPAEAKQHTERLQAVERILVQLGEQTTPRLL